MSKSITILIKQSYGRTIYYPQCDDAKTFAALAGQTTLTTANIKHIQKLGYTVYRELPEDESFPIKEGKS